MSLVLRALAALGNSSETEKVHTLLSANGINGADQLSCIRGIRYRQRNLVDDLAAILGIDFQAYAESAQSYVTSRQTKELMKQGFSIGAPSFGPSIFAIGSREAVTLETGKCNWLSTRFNYRCETFAFHYRDNRVSMEFFEKAFSDGKLRVSFGTGGMRIHSFGRNFERFSMEQTNGKANLVVAREFGVTFLRGRCM